MARYERGVYEPEDEIRVFDGSEDDDEAEGSRLPLLIVLALLVLAMFAGVVWLAYTQGVARGRTESPMLAAQPGPAQTGQPQTGQSQTGLPKTADNSGGAQAPYKGFKIYEQPAPADDEADAPAIASASPASPVTAPAPPAPQPAPQVQIAQAPPGAPPAAPAVKAAAPVVKPAAPPPLKKSTSSSAEPVLSKPAGPATAPPKRLGAAIPASAPAPAMAAGVALQIGAYKSPEDATAAWRTYEAKHAAILTGYTQDVQRADLGDKGVWYRLRVVGFSDKDAAGGVCDRLKGDGGNCFLAK